MRPAWAFVGALGLGAALMYALDPERGRARRSLVRDKATRAMHKTGDFVQAKSQHLSNRTRGLVAEATAPFRRKQPEGAQPA